MEQEHAIPTFNTSIRAVAEWLHDTYELESRVHGWQTQTSCKVPFADLPQANQRVMLKMAEAVLRRDSKLYDMAICDTYEKVYNDHFDKEHTDCDTVSQCLKSITNLRTYTSE